MFNEYVVDVDGSTVVALDTEVGTTVVLFDAGGRVKVVVGAIVSLDGIVDSGAVVVVIAGGIGGYVGAGDVGCEVDVVGAPVVVVGAALVGAIVVVPATNSQTVPEYPGRQLHWLLAVHSPLPEHSKAFETAPLLHCLNSHD
jgi:hypothetical protein